MIIMDEDVDGDGGGDGDDGSGDGDGDGDGGDDGVCDGGGVERVGKCAHAASGGFFLLKGRRLYFCICCVFQPKNQQHRRS